MFPILLLITVFTSFCQPAIIEYQRDPSRCAANWVPNWDDQRCIQYVLTWVEKLAAVGYCEAEDERLVSAYDSDKLNFIIRNGPTGLRFWIENDYDPQTWTPAQVLDESYYDSGPQCVAMEMFLLGLKMASCDLKLSTVCEKQLGSNLECPTNWTLFRDAREQVCLGFIAGPIERTHSESSLFCQQQGGRLAIPRTHAKYKALLMARPQDSKISYWLGMHFDQSDRHEPLLFDDGSSVPDCVIVTAGPQGRIGRADCFSMENAICEKYMSAPQSGNDCTEGWLRYDDAGNNNANERCIRYHNDLMNIVIAEFTCNLHNARLVQIRTAYKREFVARNRPYPIMEYWINDKRSDTMEEWSPLHGLVGNQDNPCVEMDSTSWLLVRVPCSYARSYVCEKVMDGGRACAQNWTMYNTSYEQVCLKGFSNSLSYKRAAADCRRAGGYVALPTTFAKIKAIRRAKIQDDQPMYVGMYRSSLSQIMMFDNGIEIESCRWLNPEDTTTSGFKSCGFKKRFICEKLLGTP